LPPGKEKYCIGNLLVTGYAAEGRAWLNMKAKYFYGKRRRGYCYSRLIKNKKD
jgi:hypothetical protein